MHPGSLAARIALCALLTTLPGCFGPDPNTTDSGLGRPGITIDFPEVAAPWSVQMARF